MNSEEKWRKFTTYQSLSVPNTFLRVRCKIHGIEDIHERFYSNMVDCCNVNRVDNL